MIQFKKRTAASVPNAKTGTLTLFCDENGTWRVKDSAGTVLPLSAVATPYMNAYIIAFSLAESVELPPVTAEYWIIAYNGLSSIPNVDTLVNLKSLVAAGNRLTSLPSLTQLTTLKSLVVDSNSELASLPSLAANTELIYLNAASCALTSLPSLATLGELIALDVSENAITNLPSLAALVNLQEIYVQQNQLSSIPALTGLTALRIIDASSNVLTAFPSVAGLVNLEKIFISYNSLNQAAMDAVLADCLALASANNVQDVILHLEGNTAPSAAGIADRDTLIATYNWVITTD